MARTDIPYGRESVMAASKGRASTDSKRRWRMKSATEDSGDPKITGLAPSHLDVEDMHEPAAFPEYSDTQSPTYKGRDTISSNRGSITIAPGDPWNLPLNESSDTLEYRSKAKHIKPKVNIKPMLRKMSRDDAPSTSFDLSRSSTDQDGLGIYMSMERDRRRSESLTGATYRRSSGLHNRSTSGTSQFSTGTGSSGGRTGSQYVYPMRPTPKTFTPPLSQSYQTSANESDDQEDDSPDSDYRGMSTSETPRYVRASSGPVPRLSLQIEDDSLTRLSGLSQTNISSRPSFSYSRDNGSTLDTTSPISRPSLDHVFRSRTRTSTDPISRDPISRAATVQAARQAFEEKEAAKTRRLEKQQLKADERQTRRRVKLTVTKDQESLPVPSQEPDEVISEKPTKPQGPKRGNTDQQRQSASFKSQSKSTWVLFMTWLRTRVFKFRRKLRR
ncbi:hypothetical protein N7456_005426 [Penicillium angulare]|uniref:Uncharacterized protein n=1 Tax=Penicillium angulare TaxID=116970 RepID=A0A9W9KK61_9EURO|nr:hypothetical protein N7456_005426 [Penicillium angulare]